MEGGSSRAAVLNLHSAICILQFKTAPLRFIYDEVFGGEAFLVDMTWLTDRIAVGGGIWREDNMIELVRAGVTHIIDMQIEFDDTPLAEPYGVQVLWNPIDDDFRRKPPEVFRRGVEFARAALDDPAAKIFVHCAAGVHRAPMMALALLRAEGWSLEEASDLIEARRPVADLADVYVKSVEEFMKSSQLSVPSSQKERAD